MSIYAFALLLCIAVLVIASYLHDHNERLNKLEEDYLDKKWNPTRKGE